ncbi:MAG: FHA domain-containing protein [Cyanobacteria bacterium P01_H01_bin.119]
MNYSLFSSSQVDCQTLSPSHKSNDWINNVLPLSQCSTYQDPMLLNQLFEACRFNFYQVNQAIDPILSAQSRCQLTTLYIQGITVEQRLLLATNLNPNQDIQVLSGAANWLIGNSPNCAIAVQHQAVSRCHAVLGYATDLGFYITDVGSEAGTYVNRRLLGALQRRSLRDGDLIELGHLRIEFLIDRIGQPVEPNEDETRH